MDIPTWPIARSTLITAIVAVAIAVSAFITLQAIRVRVSAREVICIRRRLSAICCVPPQGDNPKVYNSAKQMRCLDCTGKVNISKDDTPS